ncbi:hypothetical protein AAE478_004113 [Parahypoxylon ruwenzoriense]
MRRKRCREAMMFVPPEEYPPMETKYSWMFHKTRPEMSDFDLANFGNDLGGMFRPGQPRLGNPWP